MQHNGHPKAIQPVAIDMSTGLPKGVSDNLGNGRVVHDKFDVFRNLVEACNQVVGRRAGPTLGSVTRWSGLGGCGSRTR